MGVGLSRPLSPYTELIVPSETLRVCHPDQCSGHHRRHRHRKSFYYDRDSDGREREYDPVDYVPRFMSGGSRHMPWKNLDYWTLKDFDRLGQIMSEYYIRQQNNPMAPGMMPRWPPNVMPPLMMQGDDYGPSMPRSRGRRGMHSTDYPDMMDYIRRISKDHSELQDIIWGSDAENREQQWKQRQFGLWRQFMNQSTGMGMGEPMNGGFQATNGMGGGMDPRMMEGGMNPNIMRMGGGMNPQMGMGPGMGMQGMMPQQQFRGMMQPNMGGGGMPMNGMGPGGGMGQMNGYGDDMMMGQGLGGPAPGFGAGRGDRFNRGFRRFNRVSDLDEDFDEPFDWDGPPNRRRRGFRGDDGLGDGPHSPDRRPTGPRRPPPRGPGGGFCGAGATFGNEFAEPYHTGPMPSRRSSPDVIPPPPHATSAEPSVRPGMEPLRGSPPLGAGPRMQPPASVPPSDGTGPGVMPSMGAYPSQRRGGWPQYPKGMGMASTDFGAAPPYSSGIGMPGPSRFNRPAMGGHGVSFTAEASLARPREDEEDRGEPQAGAPAGKRDIQ